MEKTVFKEGDRVYHLSYGWGVIKEHNSDENYSKIMFETGKEYGFLEHFLISFTEYTLQGFSQIRPVILPEVGELCLFADEEDRTWILKEFIGYQPKSLTPYITKGHVPYRLMKRIKILD